MALAGVAERIARAGWCGGADGGRAGDAAERTDDGRGTDGCRTSDGKPVLGGGGTDGGRRTADTAGVSNAGRRVRREADVEEAALDLLQDAKALAREDAPVGTVDSREHCQRLQARGAVALSRANARTRERANTLRMPRDRCAQVDVISRR